MRGLQSEETAEMMASAFRNYYNFIEAHPTTGKVPCELAGINQNVGKNRWVGLIRLSHISLYALFLYNTSIVLHHYVW
jgi:hypothetical protein